MAHVHSEEANAYYLDQLCTIGVCGALGGVLVMLYQQDMLRYILAPQFYLPVLIGGIGLLVVVFLRAVTLWLSLGKPETVHSHDCCGHDHDHDHDHGHDHDHEHVTAAVPVGAGHVHDAVQVHDHGHDHDHGHSHGFAPWRYAVLLLPIVLYFLNLPNQAFSSNALRHLGAIELDDSTMTTETSKGKVENLSFKDLQRAAYQPDLRQELTGKVGILRGQIVPGTPDTTARLARFKMTCCAADAIPLNVTVVARDPLTDHFKPGEWVEVEGQIQFRKRKDRDEYLPVLQVESRKDIRPIPAETNPYVQ